MGYFQVRYDSRVVNYDRIGFIRLTTDQTCFFKKNQLINREPNTIKISFIVTLPIWLKLVP